MNGRPPVLYGLGRNSLWLLAGRIGTQGLMAVFTILVARRLGSAGFGEYAFVAAAVTLGNSLTSFGTDMLVIREIAARGDYSGLTAALCIQLALSTAFVALIFAGAPLLPHQSVLALTALRIYSLALFPLAFFTVFTAALRGSERMGAYTVLNLSVSILQVAGLLVILQTPGNVVTVAKILLAVQVAAAGLAGILCTVRIARFWQSWVFSWDATPAALRASAPIGLLGLFGMLYQKLGLYLLATLSGPAVTGLYSAAARPVEAAKTVHLAVFTALYPAMSRARGEEHEKVPLAESLRLSWKLLLAGAVLAAAALFLLAAPLVALLFGAEFTGTVPVLRILAWALIPYTINTFLTLEFIAAGRERAVGKALGASLIVLIALSLWWIPPAGAVGAAWAWLIAEGVQSGLLAAQRSEPALQSSRGEAHELSDLS